MRKIINKVFLFLIVFNLGILNVFADNIDSSRISSLTVSYQYDDISIEDSFVSVYFLASINDTGLYQFRDSYLDISFDPSGMNTSDISSKAEEVFSYINQMQIQPDFYKSTNHEGVSYFSDLVPGLYLVSVDSKILGEFRYDSSPMLLTIPTLDNGTYQYDVLMNVKTQREENEPDVIPPEITDSDEEVPNTLDDIYGYVVFFSVSVLIFLGVIIYILKQKGEGENEEKK